MEALELIAAERRRQIEVEGWTPEHDDQHADGVLSDAAATYAYAAGLPDNRRSNISGNFSIQNNSIARELWPFLPSWWKPTDPIRDLVKAGALIVAEIERRQRAAGLPSSPPSIGGEVDRATPETERGSTE